MDIVNGAAVRQLKVQQETKMSRIGILPKACYHELRPSVTKRYNGTIVSEQENMESDAYNTDDRV